MATTTATAAAGRRMEFTLWRKKEKKKRKQISNNCCLHHLMGEAATIGNKIVDTFSFRHHFLAYQFYPLPVYFDPPPQPPLSLNNALNTMCQLILSPIVSILELTKFNMKSRVLNSQTASSWFLLQFYWLLVGEGLSSITAYRNLQWAGLFVTTRSGRVWGDCFGWQLEKSDWYSRK